MSICLTNHHLDIIKDHQTGICGEEAEEEEEEEEHNLDPPPPRRCGCPPLERWSPLLPSRH